MKAMVLCEFNQPFRLQEVEIPKIDQGELLIRVKASGVCASNIKRSKGSSPNYPLPAILGHEPVGEVVEVGAGVDDFTIGDRVCVYIFVNCGKCFYCNAGQENNCARTKRIGIELPGAYAEYLKLPARNAVKIPDGISYEEAAVIPDAIDTPYHAIHERAKIRLGEEVGIIGVGGLGVHAVQIAKMAGAKVIAIDISPRKLEFAKKCGADETIDGKKERIVERLRSLTQGRGVDCFVDFVGTPESVRAGLNSLRKRGRFVLVGHDAYRELQAKPFEEIILGEVEIFGSHASTRQEMFEVLKLVQAGKIKPVVAARYPLTEVNEAHSALEQEEMLGRIILTP
jgi:propanol-preferring alcohol dehydrogenase